MGKKQKARREKKRAGAATPMWRETDGVHALVPGERPSDSDLDEMSRLYQEGIRRSPLWNQIVKEFGEERAEELLRQFRAEVR